MTHSLAPCPDRPNCVSSQSAEERNRVEPLRYTGSDEAAWQRLQNIVTSMPRARVVIQQARYLRAEFRSPLFRFVDDVEFRLDSARQLIEVRSAARSGYYDWGVNRRRVGEIGRRFQFPEP
jgi:uncharacterized protein (DUF1499 family)